MLSHVVPCYGVVQVSTVVVHGSLSEVWSPWVGGTVFLLWLPAAYLCCGGSIGGHCDLPVVYSVCSGAVGSHG